MSRKFYRIYCSLPTLTTRRPRSALADRHVCRMLRGGQNHGLPRQATPMALKAERPDRTGCTGALPRRGVHPPVACGFVFSPDYSAITGCSRTIIPLPGVAGAETAFANKDHLFLPDWNREVMPINVAEEVGFEPTDEFPRQRFSRPPPSTARPPLRPASLPPAERRAQWLSGSGARRGHNPTRYRGLTPGRDELCLWRARGASAGAAGPPRRRPRRSTRGHRGRRASEATDLSG